VITISGNVNNIIKTISQNNRETPKLIPINIPKTYNMKEESRISNSYIDIQRIKSTYSVSFFKKKLKKILNIIDSKLDTEKTKKEIVEIWEDNDEEDEDDID
jgi:hypothetical protein